MNKVILIGRLTKDPVIDKVGDKGTSRARFAMAVPRPFNRKETDFINCTLFGKVVDSLGQYLIKGTQIGIVGSIRTGSKDNTDGTKTYYTGVNIETVELLGGSRANSENAPSGQQSAGSGSYGQGTNPADDLTPIDDGDMPF